MKKKLFLLGMVFLFSLLIVPKIVTSDTGTIVISGADDQTIINFSGSSTANSLLSTVPDHFVFLFGDDNNKTSFHTPSITLQTLLSFVPDRFFIEHGDKNRFISLVYPKELIGDSLPPQVLSIDPQPSGSSTYLLAFDTNEYAICGCNYGTTSGVYPQTESEELYATSHNLTMDDLIEGSQVFYKISCTDRSLNTMQTQEYSFEVIKEQLLFIPMITR